MTNFTFFLLFTDPFYSQGQYVSSYDSRLGSFRTPFQRNPAADSYQEQTIFVNNDGGNNGNDAPVTPSYFHFAYPVSRHL
jgi:hypothetical protein